MENRAQLEVIAPSIEEAVAKGLQELGLPEEAVEIEVLDSGTRGLFGLGSRHARVRLTIKGASSIEPAPAPAAELPSDEPISQTRPEEQETELDEMAFYEDLEEEAFDEGPSEEFEAEAEERDIQILEVASNTVRELLEKMKITAEVTADYNEEQEIRGRTPVYIDIYGKDLSILIGRQAETLNALQYVTGLIVGKELGRSVPIIIDVEGYRKRKEKQLRHLARRMADQAIKTGRRQVLEPMPSNERRIVHIELRDHPEVTTESVGEEPRRKVTIIPR